MARVALAPRQLSETEADSGDSGSDVHCDIQTVRNVHGTHCYAAGLVGFRPKLR